MGINTAIKTVGDWTLEVLGCPFGSVMERDAHGEWFSPQTNFHETQIPLPPVVYYHGFTPEGTPQGSPAFIGRTVRREVRDEGVWYRVVLDQANGFAQRVWEAARQGLARASTGTLAHLRRVGQDGHIQHWLVSELSLFDAGAGRQPANRYAVAVPVVKALYRQAGIDLRLPLDEIVVEDCMNHEGKQTGEQQVVLSAAEFKRLLHQAHQAGIQSVSVPQPVTGDALKTVLDDFTREVSPQNRQVTTTMADIQQMIDTAASRARRLPLGGEPGWGTPLKYGDLRRYDHLSAADQAVLCGVLMAPHRGAHSRPMISEAALKALAFKLEEDKSEIGEVGRIEMKLRGIKAGEIMGSTTTDYGDEWVGTAYSTALWREIRNGTFVANKLRNVEVPRGSESMVLPLESTDPEFYHVSQASGYTSNRVDPTVSALGSKTSNATLNLAKMGARTIFTGELEEDSVIPIANQLRMQLAEAGAETLEWVIIDGDTATDNTNINAIGLDIADNTVYTMFDGFRKAAIAGGTDTGRDAAGSALQASDFVLTAQLMGEAGYAALEAEKVGFLIPLSVHWRFMTVAEFMTADKVANPTIEHGILKRIFGIPVYTSAQMLRASTGRKAQDDGTISSTEAQNTLGTILCVRWDQWTLGWRRRMTLETVRRPESDSTEIIALMRCGLVKRSGKTAATMTRNISLT